MTEATRIVQLSAAGAEHLRVAAHGARTLAPGVWELTPDVRVDEDMLSVLAHDVRFVEHVVDAQSRGLSLVTRVAERLGRAGVEDVIALGRGLTPHAAWLREHLGSARSAAEGGRLVLLGRRTVWVTRPGLPWLADPLNRGAEARLQDPDVSRAEVKWLQTAPLLEHLGFALERLVGWLELGAAPGGMTAQLAQLGRVTAVDLAPLAPQVSALPRVAYVHADTRTWTSGGAYDALVCDMNGPVRTALAATARHAHAVRVGCPIVITLKLASWATFADARALALTHLEQAPCELLTVRQLTSHRANECVLIARRGEA